MTPYMWRWRNSLTHLWLHWIWNYVSVDLPMWRSGDRRNNWHGSDRHNKGRRSGVTTGLLNGGEGGI